MLCVLFIGLVAVFAKNWTPSPELGFFEHGLEHQRQIHENFWIAWSAFPENNTVLFALAVNEEGWIGFGPSETGNMIGGNPCVVREEPVGSGQMQAFAMHSTEFTTPTMNKDQNCELLDYNRVNGESYAKIARPLDGCRPEDIDIVDDWDLRYIAAWGDSQVFTYHAERRALTEFNALLGPPPTYELPPDAKPFDVTLDEYVLPDYRDVNFCRAIRLPNDQRYHVVMVEPILRSEEISPAMHHHYNVFVCTYGIPDEWQDMLTKPCGLVPGCFQFFTTWLAGGGQQWYMDAALPIGQGEGAAYTILVQGHIDNPSAIGGTVVPPWGMRFWYTPTLRPIEAGDWGMIAGLPLVGIAPGIPAALIRGDCGPGCTTSGFPPDGITVTAVAPHMHYHGVSIHFQHLRFDEPSQQWIELPELHRLQYWDPTMQGARQRKSVKVYPGDRVIINCVFNTVGRTEPLRGGESYEDEMCMSSLTYYPRVVQSGCIQYPNEAIVNFCDTPPFFAPVGNYTYVPLPEKPNNCKVRNSQISG